MIKIPFREFEKILFDKINATVQTIRSNQLSLGDDTDEDKMVRAIGDVIINTTGINNLSGDIYFTIEEFVRSLPKKGEEINLELLKVNNNIFKKLYDKFLERKGSTQKLFESVATIRSEEKLRTPEYKALKSIKDKFDKEVFDRKKKINIEAAELGIEGKYDEASKKLEQGRDAHVRAELEKKYVKTRELSFEDIPKLGQDDRSWISRKLFAMSPEAQRQQRINSEIEGMGYDQKGDLYVEGNTFHELQREIANLKKAEQELKEAEKQHDLLEIQYSKITSELNKTKARSEDFNEIKEQGKNFYNKLLLRSFFEMSRKNAKVKEISFKLEGLRKELQKKSKILYIVEKEKFSETLEKLQKFLGSDREMSIQPNKRDILLASRDGLKSLEKEFQQADREANNVLKELANAEAKDYAEAQKARKEALKSSKLSGRKETPLRDQSEETKVLLTQFEGVKTRLLTIKDNIEGVKNMIKEMDENPEPMHLIISMKSSAMNMLNVIKSIATLPMRIFSSSHSSEVRTDSHSKNSEVTSEGKDDALLKPRERRVERILSNEERAADYRVRLPTESSRHLELSSSRASNSGSRTSSLGRTASTKSIDPNYAEATSRRSSSDSPSSFAHGEGGAGDDLRRTIIGSFGKSRSNIGSQFQDRERTASRSSSSSSASSSSKASNSGSRTSSLGRTASTKSIDPNYAEATSRSSSSSSAPYATTNSTTSIDGKVDSREEKISAQNMSTEQLQALAHKAKDTINSSYTLVRGRFHTRQEDARRDRTNPPSSRPKT